MAPERTVPDDATAVVTGSVVLGLLPYTIARGAFGIGTTVCLDQYSESAVVGFGPMAALGVTDWLTLGAVIPVVTAPVAEDRTVGLGNVGVATQLKFFDDAASGIALSATPGVTLPSPSEVASSDTIPDLKLSGAVNVGPVALNLTARGSVAVSAEDGERPPQPGFDSALSLIMVDDTFAPFAEAAFGVSDGVVPTLAAGLNWAPGGGALFTAGLPVVFKEGEAEPGFSFTAYFETEIFGGSATVAHASSVTVAQAR